MPAKSPARKTEKTPPKAVVFISYAREDKKFVERLEALLRERGIKTTGDWELQAGVRYADPLRAAIMSADTFLFVITPSSVNSPACNGEIDIAVKNNKRLAPVVREDVPDDKVHPALREIHYTFLREHDNFEEQLKQLERGIKTDPEWVKAHTYWLQSAADWDTKKRARGALLRGEVLLEAERWLAEASADAAKDPRPTPLQSEYIITSRQDEKKRQRFTLGAVTGGLIVALVLLLIAVSQYRVAVARTAEAERERNRAEQNEQAARKAEGEAKEALARETQAKKEAEDALGREKAAKKEAEDALARETVAKRRAVEAAAAERTARSAEEVARKNAERATKEALQNLAQAYVEKADRAWQDKDVGGVEILLANALTMDDRRETREKLWEARAKGAQFRWATSYRPSGSDALFTRDGSHVILGCDDFNVRVWDVATGQATRVLRGHKSLILAVALGPSERLLASGGADRTIRLWDLTTGAEVRALIGHEDHVRSLAFADGGRTLVSVGQDNTLRVWNVADGKQLTSARLKWMPLRLSALSPDARFLAYTGGDEVNVIRLLDTRTGAELAPLKHHTREVTALAFSDDGRRLASQDQAGSVHVFDTLDPSGPSLSPRTHEHTRGLAFSHDGLRLATYYSYGAEKHVVVWDARTGREVHKFPVESSLTEVRKIVFSADGRWLAAAGDTLRLWNLASEKEVFPIAGHGSSVRSIAYSPDGRLIASCGFDHTVRLWDAGDGRERRVFKAQDCRRVIFSPDATMIAANDSAARVRIWDVESGTSLYTFETSAPRTTGLRDSLAFSPEGDAIYEAVDGDEFLSWRVEPRQQPVIPEGFATSGRESAFSPDGNMIAMTDANRLRLLNLINRQEIIDKDLGTYLTALAFTADGSQLAVADEHGVIRIWSTAEGKELKTFRSPGAGFEELAFSQDGQRLASAGSGVVNLWDVSSGAEILRLTPQRSRTRRAGGLAFSPDGRFVAVGGEGEGAIRVWSVENSNEVTTLRGHRNYISNLSYDAEGRLLLTEGLDETARLWDVADARAPRLLAKRGGVKASSLSPDGRMLAVSSGGETIQISDAATGNSLFELREERGKVIKLAFSEDGRLASAVAVETNPEIDAEDYYVSVWDLAGKRRVVSFKEGPRLECMVFAPKGLNLLATCGAQTFSLRNLETGEQIRTFKGHRWTVTSLAFSRDGKRMASASRDGTVRLWDVESGQEVYTFYGHTGWAEGVAFSPDERLIASVGADRTIRFWDAQTGREAFKLRAPADSAQTYGSWVRRIAFNPKTSVVAASTGDFSVRLWDLNSLTRFFSAAPAVLLEESQNQTGLQISGLEYVQLR